jgi:hypothetical protein
LLPGHLQPWAGLLKNNWPADAGPVPDQSAVNKAQKLLGAFDERSRRPDLAIIMYCRPEGASNVEVRSATEHTWTQKAKKLHLQRKLDFMKAKMPDGALRYFIGLPDSRGTPNKTLTERAQALAAKVAKAEARANAKLVGARACDPSDGCRKPRAPRRERARARHFFKIPCYFSPTEFGCESSRQPPFL